jgi:hypothetical protein
MLRPPIGDLVLGIPLPEPDPQLPETVVDDRLKAETRGERFCRLHRTDERARHKPVDRLLTKDIGDRRGGPNPNRLDALVAPTHRPALAVRDRAAVANQVYACHPSLLSVTDPRPFTTPVWRLAAHHRAMKSTDRRLTLSRPWTTPRPMKAFPVLVDLLGQAPPRARIDQELREIGSGRRPLTDADHDPRWRP